MSNTIKLDLFDTTLRDGAQKFKDYPTNIEATLIASVLAQLGIGHIEIGIPITENQTKERFELIINAVEQTGENPVLYGFCRCIREDINAVLDKMEIAKNKGINIIVSGSELFQILRDSSLKNKNLLELTSQEIFIMEETILENIREQVYYASNFFGNNVRVCFEDGSMGKKDFLVKAIKIAGESGAKIISIPDTLGGILPHEIEDLFRYLINETIYLQEKGLRFAIHTHNDRGLALANTLSAIKAGATSIEGTLLGSGERVGNLNLKDLIGNIATLENGRLIEGKEIECSNIVLEKLYESYKIIYSLLGKQWDPNTPFVGEQCTKTQVGIHQSLENKNKEELRTFFEKYGRITPYSLVDINKFGVPQLELNMYTNLSGFSNLESCLKPYGVILEKDDLLVQKILIGLQTDLDNTKVVYASRVFFEYLIQTGKIFPLNSEDIEINKNKVSIKIIIFGKEIILEEQLSKKDGALGTTIKAINTFLEPEYSIKLTDFSLKMHEGEDIITKRYPNILKETYKLCGNNGEKQVGIANIEGVFINKITNESIPFTTTAHDLHGDIANIKAILYACIPIIYEKIKKMSN